MQIRKFISITALLVILALTTNSLLALHLRACQTDHTHHEHEECPSDEDQHDTENCQICQDLLVTTSQYMIDSPLTALFIETENSHPFQYATTLLSQITCSSIRPRGPPLS